MKIWAHRGCSLQYPENTRAAFNAAAKLPGLTGIELDIQLTADNRIVVIHDETVERTTNGKGSVKDYCLKDLKRLRIKKNWLLSEHVSTIEEIFELLEKPMAKGLLLNIELKNGKTVYDSMERKIIDMVRALNLLPKVIFSSFNADSLNLLHQIEPEANIGILAPKTSQCLNKLKNGCPASDLHPSWHGIDVPSDTLAGFNVRAYGYAPLFPDKKGETLNLEYLKSLGITDVFVNDPEAYLMRQFS